ncbi:MaoC family dehydratase [Gillisia hiemivivida]|uniref:MaoC family dehydratase n=1 Tax=Gillisia hiemivivida TaxID=291190 RepID=A0A5C6ZPZ6_9FLAO|nr:MaoC family dehydratase [Gillisia hiemivivida]TXD92857.1 MaoC family dehydratase [Gillisia hiemivivida]
MNKVNYKDLKVGDNASLTKTFSENNVLKFSLLSGDENPIHFDQEYALTTRFKKRIVQGPYVAALFGGILGSEVPGPGTIYINQNTNFIAPVFIGDTVTANVEILSIREDKPIIKLRTWATKNDEIVMDGEATILFLKN